MLRVLVADDDPGIVRTLMLGLKMMGCQPVGVESAEAASKALEDKSADLLLTDMRMEGMSGVDLVRDAHARWPEMICVVMTAFASYENAVSAIKAGAYDYLPKPFTTEQLEHLIRKVEMLVDLQRENSRLRAGSGDWFDGLTSPKCQALQSVVERIAPSDATVLLSGETGSGKTELARSIHRRSARADKPFVEVTCTAIAENLFESEVFGHVRGPLPERCAIRRANSSWRTAAPCSLTKSGNCRLRRSPSCCVSLKIRSSNGLGTISPSGWMCASLPRRTGILPL